jgi:HAD superfamily hydrolase (TIGR01509 family)
VYDRAVIPAMRGSRLGDVVAILARAHDLAPDFGGALLDTLRTEFHRLLDPMPGAAHALDLVTSLGWPAAVASSSPLALIDAAVARCGWATRFRALCSGDEVAHGKPAPDVFLLAARRLRCAPADCVVFEDSANGIRAARAAGMRCIAVPSPEVDAAALGAGLVLPSLAALTKKGASLGDTP